VSIRADVVVVGGGGSGLAAAVSAAENGGSVVLLEKNETLGGTTARSVGSISATRTPHQQRAGIADSPEEHYRDMPLFATHLPRGDNDTLRRILTENVPDTLQWLSAMGAEFYGPMEEPPHTKPRMHNILPNSRAYIYHLERRARALGVRILAGRRAQKLVVEEGRVTGVQFDPAAPEGGVAHAQRGVILAAGDYSADPELKMRLISEAAARTEPVNPTNTGDGQKMALALGARIVNGDLHGGGLRFVPPPHPAWVSRLPPKRWLMRAAGFALRNAPAAIVRPLMMGFLTTVLVPTLDMFQSGAVLINRDGERFVDERKILVYELAFQPEGIAYILFDAAVARKFSAWPHYISTAPGIAYAYLQDYARTRPDLVHEAPTLEALAHAIGADPGKLAASVRAFNASGGVDTDSADRLARRERPPIGEGPYLALGPVKNYISFTDGGIMVNTRLQVLGPDDVPIPGLFAAGSNGQGGLLLQGHGHHLGWAFTSGRLAGRYAIRGFESASG